MAQLHLAVLVLEAQLHAVGLEGLEVAHRAYLKPALLCGAPHLEVKGHGRGETDVAATEFQYVVGETQLVEQAAHVFLHLFQHRVAAVGVLDDHNLNLRELMQTVEAAYVLAVAACFAAEAFAVAHTLDGQILGVYYLAAEDVGDGHFGCGSRPPR